MKLKRLTCLFLALILSLSVLSSFSSCTPHAPSLSLPSDSMPPEESYEEREYLLSDIRECLTLLGRASVTQNGIAADMTASGVALCAYVEGSVTFTLEATSDCYFRVYIDGVRQSTRYHASGVGRITVEGLGALRLREIRLVKETEAQFSLATLHSVSFYGRLADKPSEKKHYIEFIGDSITCGYGNLWKDGDEGTMESGLYQDGTQAYAYLAAEALGADYAIVSCSGIGVAEGWRDFTMKDFYTRASYYRSKYKKHDFAAARTPDLVVINLGTNDRSLRADPDVYQAAVCELIQCVRDSYRRDVPIVWAYGAMGDSYRDYTKAAILSLGGEESGLYTVELPRNQGGGNGHPTCEGQDAAATVLVAYFSDTGLLK